MEDKERRVRVWTALLDSENDLWKAYVINVEPKLILEETDLCLGREAAFEELEELIAISRERAANDG